MVENSAKPLWACVILVNFMSLAAGFLSIIWQNNGVMISGPIEGNFGYYDYQWYTQILYPLGGLFGSIISGYLAHRFGRIRTILPLGLPFAVAFLLVAIFFESDVVAVAVASFLGGFAAGGILVVLPVYIVEVAENRNRGRLASVIHFFYSLGFILSILLYATSSRGGLVVGVVGIIFIAISLGVIFFIVYETPQFLILNKQEEEAKKSLQRYRDTLEVDEEYLEIRDVTLSQSSSRGVLQALALFVFRGLSGAEITIAYGDVIQWREDDLPGEYILYKAFTTYVPLIASILAIFLMDTVGRRTILAISTVGIFIAQIIIGIYIEPVDLNGTYWLIVVCTTMAKVLYSVGLATLPFIVAAELQPSNKKPLVLGATASITWFINFILAGYYFTIVKSLGDTSVFWFFPVVNVIALVYYSVFLTETVKKSAKEINDSL